MGRIGSVKGLAVGVCECLHAWLWVPWWQSFIPYLMVMMTGGVVEVLTFKLLIKINVYAHLTETLIMQHVFLICLLNYPQNKGERFSRFLGCIQHIL